MLPIRVAHTRPSSQRASSSFVALVMHVFARLVYLFVYELRKIQRVAHTRPSSQLASSSCMALVINVFACLVYFVLKTWKQRREFLSDPVQVQGSPPSRRLALRHRPLPLLCRVGLGHLPLGWPHALV